MCHSFWCEFFHICATRFAARFVTYVPPVLPLFFVTYVPFVLPLRLSLMRYSFWCEVCHICATHFTALSHISHSSCCKVRQKYVTRFVVRLVIYMWRGSRPQSLCFPQLSVFVKDWVFLSMMQVLIIFYSVINQDFAIELSISLPDPFTLFLCSCIMSVK